MGTDVILLLYYISPIIYADNAFRRMILNADAMYDAVAKAAAKQQDSNKCHPGVAKFNLPQVRCGLQWMNEIPRRLKFWNELVPELMQWLSAQAIECGIYSVINTEDRHRFTGSINDYPSNFINALQNLAYSLLQVIAEIHNKADFKSTYMWLQDLTRNSNLNWEQNWLAAYEFWYTAYEYRGEYYPSPTDYLQMVITNSFDNLMRWLADYMGLPTKTSTTTRPPEYPPDNPPDNTILSPTEYSEFLRIFGRQALQKVYLPKSPRRPILMLWPSVMNPAVYEALLTQISDWDDSKKDKVYTIMICERRSVVKFKIDIDVVKREIHPFDELNMAPKFFGDFVPQLILWLCGKTLLCGFITFFTNQRHEIYRFIDANRNNYIRAVQELVYILLQMIAVIHHKTIEFSIDADPSMSNVHWIPRWAEAYEQWYEYYLEMNRTRVLSSVRRYIQNIIANSFDIVMAWLFDYLAQRARTSRTSFVSIPFWAHADWEKWKLSDDPEIVCALESFDMAPALGWDYLLGNVHDKLTVMRDNFLKCRESESESRLKRQNGCDFEGPITINIADKILRPPSAEDCHHMCSELKHPADAYVYGHAHMTTAVGLDLYCKINSTNTSLEHEGMRVIAPCYPLVAEKYIKDRQYMMCKSKSKSDTITGTITLTKMYPNKD